MKSQQVSALAWGALAIGLVFLITPTKAYAYPLILTLTFGDPFMGELRRRGVESKFSYCLCLCPCVGDLAVVLVYF